MPSRTVDLSVVGDSSGATRALNQVEQKSTQTASKASGA
jgi:hypothetical protein